MSKVVKLPNITTSQDEGRNWLDKAMGSLTLGLIWWRDEGIQSGEDGAGGEENKSVSSSMCC